MRRNKKKSKTIVVVASSLAKGGMERQLTMLLDGLVKEYDVTLALFRKNVEYPLNLNVKIIDFKKKYKLDILFLCRFFIFFLKNRKNIIHARGDGANYYTLIFSILLKIEKVIVEFRNSGEKYFSQYRHTGFIFKHFAPKSWLIIANSKTSADELKYIADLDAQFIQNGVNTKLFCKRGSAKSDQLTLGFVGRIVRQKNITLIVDAVHLLLKEVPDLSLQVLVVGKRVDEEYFSDITRKISKQEIENVFSFIDSVPDPENYYPKLDIFILPSHHEGTPNVLLEAMACEVYSLASVNANCENILPGQFVFSDMKAQELTKQIKKYLTLNTSKKNIICSDLRDIIEKKYSIRSMIKAYKEVYDNL